jgi:hypothetical protein
MVWSCHPYLNLCNFSLLLDQVLGPQGLSWPASGYSLDTLYVILSLLSTKEVLCPLSLSQCTYSSPVWPTPPSNHLAPSDFSFVVASSKKLSRLDPVFLPGTACICPLGDLTTNYSDCFLIHYMLQWVELCPLVPHCIPAHGSLHSTWLVLRKDSIS